jgi:hypothetical protein
MMLGMSMTSRAITPSYVVRDISELNEYQLRIHFVKGKVDDLFSRVVTNTPVNQPSDQTNKQTPWCRALRENLIIPQLVRKFPES